MSPVGKARILQAYRLLVLVAIVGLAHRHHARLTALGERPLTLQEVRAVLPQAVALEVDAGPRAGFVVPLRDRPRPGYAIRTAPQANDILGYAGPADTLLVFDPDDRVVGMVLRHSHDTPGHIRDVVEDTAFMRSFNGRSWEDLEQIDRLQDAGIYGVSGATRTSRCIAEGVVHRVRSVGGATPPAFHWSLTDAGLLLVLAGAVTLAFGRGAWRKKWRPRFQWVVILYLGWITSELLAQSLLTGWVAHGLPWRFTPGLVLLALAAFLVPWSTGRPLYCAHICPHGMAQEKLGRLSRRKWHPPGWLADGLKWIPGLLLALVLVGFLLRLPLDTAATEAFDAWANPTTLGISVVLAVMGLALSVKVPMAYCHYGCPTGELFRFLRTHRGADHFTWRDGGALCLLALTVVLTWFDPSTWPWLGGAGL